MWWPNMNAIERILRTRENGYSVVSFVCFGDVIYFRALYPSTFWVDSLAFYALCPSKKVATVGKLGV